MIRRPPRSTLDRSSAASDVYKTQPPVAAGARSATLEVARQVLAEREAEVAERVELVSVDYLRDELPGPVDVIFISNIIHSEDEAVNADLARKCCRALARGGTASAA